LYGKWLTGSSQAVTYYITKSNNSAYRVVYGLDDKFGMYIDDSNQQIQTEASTYLDFSEKHPFGDP
jgi:hypothetical protein